VVCNSCHASHNQSASPVLGKRRCKNNLLTLILNTGTKRHLVWVAKSAVYFAALIICLLIFTTLSHLCSIFENDTEFIQLHSIFFFFVSKKVVRWWVVCISATDLTKQDPRGRPVPRVKNFQLNNVGKILRNYRHFLRL